MFLSAALPLNKNVLGNSTLNLTAALEETLLNPTDEKILTASQGAFSGIAEFASWGMDLSSFTVKCALSGVLMGGAARCLGRKPKCNPMLWGIMAGIGGFSGKLFIYNPAMQTLNYFGGSPFEKNALKLLASFVPPLVALYRLAQPPSQKTNEQNSEKSLSSFVTSLDTQ